jgi:hypothetical protein
MFRRQSAKKKRAPKSGDVGCDECKPAARHQLAGILHGRPEVSQNKFRRAVNYCAGPEAEKQKTSGAKIVHPKSKNESKTKGDKRGNLPAVAAVTTVAAITATSAAATTAPAAIAATASAAPPTAAIASTPTAATRPLGLRTRFIDYQVPATEILTVKIGDGAIRFFIICNFDEGEPARLPREPIPNQIDCGRVYPYLSEPLLQLLFGCREREITDVKLLHLGTPSARNLTTIAERTERPVPPGGQTGGRAARAGRVFQWSRRYSRKSSPFATRKGLERGSPRGRTGIAPAAKSDRMREQAGGETG